MDVEEFRKRGYEMIDFICDYHKKIESFPVQSTVAPGEITKSLPSEAPLDPQSMDDIMKDVNNLIIPGLTHWQSPNFFGYYPSNGSFPAILGDMLSTGFGVQGMLWSTSPACTELETVVLDWLGKILQLPGGFLFSNGGGGVIQGTASEAVLTCLVAARHKITKEYAEKGISIDEVNSKVTVYTSDQAHTCVKKACVIAGIPLERVRMVETDESLAMKPESLRKHLQDDKKAGLIPCFVSCTVGTTSTSAFDDVKANGQVCQEENVWLHVDAAYAGSAATCPEYRYLIDGVELASSFNFNPHKWLLTSFDCSTLWVQNRDILIESLSLAVPAFLKNKASDAGLVVDYRNWQIPLGRRFRALKLWFVLRLYGVRGIQKHIRDHVYFAEVFENLVKGNPNFEVLYPRKLSLICFRLKASNETNKALLDKLLASGKMLVTSTIINDVFMFRFAIGATSVTEEHVVNAWKIISTEGEALLKTQ